MAASTASSVATGGARSRPSPIETDRLAAQAERKLGLVVSAHFGRGDTTPAPFPGGAARRRGSTGWVHPADDPARSLGRALAWARQHALDELHLVVDGHAGLLARRAALFDTPVTVWWLQGAALHRADPEPAPPVEQPPDAPELAGLLINAGLDVVAEHGHLAGELRGLEVARVTAHGLEVGVGAADRELTAMVHGDLPPASALARVAEIVGDKRRPGAPRHPLNQLVPERWLRWTVRNDPARVGMGHLDASPSALPRRGLRERDIATAVGDGVVAVFSVGVDLDLVPAAAETRSALDPDARLLLVVPERDDHPITRALAASLSDPAEIVTVAGDWRS